MHRTESHGHSAKINAGRRNTGGLDGNEIPRSVAHRSRAPQRVHATVVMRRPLRHVRIRQRRFQAGITQPLHQSMRHLLQCQHLYMLITNHPHNMVGIRSAFLRIQRHDSRITISRVQFALRNRETRAYRQPVGRHYEPPVPAHLHHNADNTYNGERTLAYGECDDGNGSSGDNEPRHKCHNNGNVFSAAEAAWNHTQHHGDERYRHDCAQHDDESMGFRETTRHALHASCIVHVGRYCVGGCVCRRHIVLRTIRTVVTDAVAGIVIRIVRHAVALHPSMASHCCTRLAIVADTCP